MQEPSDPGTSIIATQLFTNAYASAPTVLDQILGNIGPARLVDNPQLFAELTAARHLAFQLEYVEVMRKFESGILTEENPEAYYRDNPAAAAIRYAGGGYIKEELINVLAPSNPREGEDFRRHVRPETPADYTYPQ